MQTLLRHIHTDRKGREEVDERVLDESVITVGHGGDQSIPLRDPQVARRHLELRPSASGKVRYRIVDGAASIAGATRRRGTLKPGDRIELGRQAIVIGPPEGGFDAVLEVVTVESDRPVGAATHHRIELAQAGLGMRRPAWMLAIAVLLLFLVVPLVGYFWPEIGDDLRRNPLLPSDHAWSSGPLAGVHHTPEIGLDCRACHQTLFERAPDRACLDCHADVSGHVDVEAVSVPMLDDLRCAACHREHLEPSRLVREDAALCVDCHRAPGELAVALGSHPLPELVAGFSRTDHPPFQLALLRLDSPGDWRMERVPRSTPGVIESSNLKFPHDLHLDPSKVESLSTGEALACASCHALGTDGEHFRTLSMEAACQDCHSLSFDDDFSRKQLPHGDVESVLIALEEHYIRKYADPELRSGPAERGRRRPGRSRSDETCEGTALECGRRQALQEATNQFSRSGCATCHEVGTDPARPYLERWTVQPVRLVDDWYPYAGFDHEVHLTRSRARMDEDVACSACHAAETSATSEDVLIPGLDNCLACHGPSGAGETTVALSCRGCHDFHLPFRGPMRAHDAVEGVPGGGTVSHLLREGEPP